MDVPGSSAGRIHRQCRRPQVISWVRQIHWRRDRQPTPVFLVFPGGSAERTVAKFPSHSCPQATPAPSLQVTSMTRFCLFFQRYLCTNTLFFCPFLFYTNSCVFNILSALSCFHLTTSQIYFYIHVQKRMLNF